MALSCALAATLLLAVSGGAAAETHSKVFGYTGSVQTFTVPDGVRQLKFDLSGGHGAWTERTNTGGRGGRVQGVLAVSPGDVLDVYVGAYGGWGFGHGGDGGGSTDWGHDGKTGGGGSAILAVDESPLVVGGGGGGGGGDGAGDGYYGGHGGDGGRPAQRGEDARHADGGSGGGPGCDGCRGRDGDDGEGTDYGSGGGGGGGGYVGAQGGHGADGVEAGGGGGGGGLSYAAQAVQQPQFGANVAGGDRASGYVRISWVVDTPSQVAVYGDSSGQRTEVGTLFGRALRARVTAQDGDPVAGAHVRFTTPATGPTATFAGGARAVTATADANGVATAPPLTASLGAGAWTATASVVGVSAHASFSMLNEAAATTMALSPSAQPSAFGQPVTYAAYVTAAPTAGSPQGTVSFSVDGVPLGGPVTLVNGAATSASIATLRPGRHKVEATFTGATSTFAPAASSATQTVDPALASLRLTSSDNPTEVGHVLFFTADVSAVAPGGGTPDGKVAFSVDGNPLETVDLVDGQARTNAGWSPLVAGHRQVLATYLPAGDPGNPADLPRYVSTAASLDQAVGPGSTTTTVTSSAEPAVAGQAVTLTATVAGGEVLAPSGTVTFTLDGSEVCRNVALALVDGRSRATCNVDSERLPVGGHEVLASYSGSPAQSLQPSSGALTQRVERASVDIEVLSQPDPTVFGQMVTMSAAVDAVAPGSGTPTGTVQFLADGQEIGIPRPLDGAGRASLVLLGQLPAGPMVVAARYSGDADFRSRQVSETHAVGRAEVAVALTPSSDPSLPGEPVTFGAHVAAVAPGAGNPEGQLQFHLDGEPLGEPVDIGFDGLARSPQATGLTLGAHDVTASYLGDHDFLPGQATAVQQVGLAAGTPSGGASGGGGSAGSPTGCGEAPLLTEVHLVDGRVRLTGLAPVHLAGRRVSISAGRRTVARATVRTNGSFVASARRPRGRGWRATRYRAVVDGRTSPAVKLVRRLAVHARRWALGPHLRVQVRVASGRRDRVALAIGRRGWCPASAERRTAKIRTDRRGRATVSLAPPRAGRGPVLYRVWALHGRASSLPIVVRAHSESRGGAR